VWWGKYPKTDMITLGQTEYLAALEHASSAEIVGAALCDALIAHCALKAAAAVLLTWNVRDFARISRVVADLVKTPADL